MYILTKSDEQPNHNGAVLSIMLKRLGDIKRHLVDEGATYRVYRSRTDYNLGRVHGIYVVQDGRLVRDKRRTALRHIHELFGEDISATAYS